MIKMICGACRVEGKLKRASDGPFTLSPAEETRLVNAGVAVFVATWRQNRADSPVEGGDAGGASIDPPDKDTALEGLENGGSEDTAELQEGEIETEGTLDAVNGHITVESLMEMTRADMEKLAADMGVNVSKCKSKGEIAALLSAVEVQAGESGEAPPELGAEAPVV